MKTRFLCWDLGHCSLFVSSSLTAISWSDAMPSWPWASWPPTVCQTTYFSQCSHLLNGLVVYYMTCLTDWLGDRPMLEYLAACQAIDDVKWLVYLLQNSQSVTGLLVGSLKYWVVNFVSVFIERWCKDCPEENRCHSINHWQTVTWRLVICIARWTNSSSYWLYITCHKTKNIKDVILFFSPPENTVCVTCNRDR